MTVRNVFFSSEKGKQTPSQNTCQLDQLPNKYSKRDIKFSGINFQNNEPSFGNIIL